MLRTIGILVFLSISSNAFSHEYEVTLSDQLNGEVVIEKCANEIELNNVVDYAESLNNSSLKFSVKKLIPIQIMAIKKGGGEGSGD
ncbi:MAG: hypothetical protein H7281_15145 [Bacteriovorax sp.]|nr:hypothetical protein [Bacteriovorax sp.]